MTFRISRPFGPYAALSCPCPLEEWVQVNSIATGDSAGLTEAVMGQGPRLLPPLQPPELRVLLATQVWASPPVSPGRSMDQCFRGLGALQPAFVQGRVHHFHPCCWPLCPRDLFGSWEKGVIG